MRRNIPPRSIFPDDDCMTPDPVSTVARRADLGHDLKRKLLGAKLFNRGV